MRVTVFIEFKGFEKVEGCEKPARLEIDDVSEAMVEFIKGYVGKRARFRMNMPHGAGSIEANGTVLSVEEQSA